jgi:two-component sensor histidine kinase/PAS domain-containing protein
MQTWSPSGLRLIPQLQWGSHLAHFFEEGDALRDMLVPYFKAGLENNERCLWVTGPAFGTDDARAALRAAVPDLDQREAREQIEIVDGGAWYSASEPLKPGELVDGLLQREREALDLGYTGLRTHGDCAWVGPAQWNDFVDYEGLVQHAMRGRRMICMCSHCADLAEAAQLDIIARHDLTVPGSRVARPARALTQVPILVSAKMEKLKQRFDMVMSASQMGTWRYTLADNICTYDDNAQALYGLDGPIFLHDADGVKGKFHPDDMERMWTQVQAALDPKGDGRYDVEYRVRQKDGSWRWLSAWGLVEFEPSDDGRKPIAIVGASRDISQLKHAEELQQLLVGELNHRVRNTLATLQAIAVQTLRAAPDLESATDVLTKRIAAMSRANDLLSCRRESHAKMSDLVARALDAFGRSQIEIVGPPLEVSSKHVTSLSMALHELATNAAKYGALSMPNGRVRVAWQVANNILNLTWTESGGPKVIPPSHTGFGSRLLEVAIRDVGGSSIIDYEPNGVRCTIMATL